MQGGVAQKGGACATSQTYTQLLPGSAPLGARPPAHPSSVPRCRPHRCLPRRCPAAAPPLPQAIQPHPHCSACGSPTDVDQHRRGSAPRAHHLHLCPHIGVRTPHVGAVLLQGVACYKHAGAFACLAFWLAAGARSAAPVPLAAAALLRTCCRYVGAAYATVWSSVLSTALVATYVRWSNLHHRVWCTPNGLRLQASTRGRRAGRLGGGQARTIVERCRVLALPFAKAMVPAQNSPTPYCTPPGMHVSGISN